MIGVFDYDYCKYQLAAAGEKRSIRVTHPSGLELEFKTRTEFYGRAPKYSGGWLADYNKDKPEPLQIHEWTIEDVQTPEPVEYILSSVKGHINNIREKLRLNEYYGYIGKGDSWRVEKSTLLKYKGQRAALLKPVHLEAVEEYLVKYHNAQYIEHLEADDKVVMDCYGQYDKVLIGCDKDFLGCNRINLFNPDKYDNYVHVNGLGYLGLEEKIDSKGRKTKTVRGQGRKFFYYQILSGDSSDNYKANCMSDIEWGDISAYNALVNCRTDAECWQAIADSYRLLYPEKKVVKGWRNDDIEIDWLYVLQENATMAHMLRAEGDSLDVQAILGKMGVE